MPILDSSSPHLLISLSRSRNIRFVIVFICILLFPFPSDAHLVTTGAGPFYDGSAHFFVTFDEILPVIALSLFAGLRGTRSARWVLAILFLGWLGGGIFGRFFPMNETPFWFQTILLLGTGILLASDWKISASITWIISGFIAITLGFWNGSAMAAAGGGMLAVIGTAASALIVSVFGMALAVKLSEGWTRIALRVAGSWIAALGLLSLGWALRK